MPNELPPFSDELDEGTSAQPVRAQFRLLVESAGPTQVEKESKTVTTQQIEDFGSETRSTGKDFTLVREGPTLHAMKPDSDAGTSGSASSLPGSSDSGKPRRIVTRGLISHEPKG